MQMAMHGLEFQCDLFLVMHANNIDIAPKLLCIAESMQYKVSVSNNSMQAM
jgi:hypothetical protein